ncbi:MAG TPA: hydantoinase B/oxoprolinase family protein [Chloroflexota bacterium]|nr:hydantoinase B/oxoprolinase family protein [Chloroflexota bacterium]
MIETAPAAPSTVDAFTIEVIRASLVAFTDEMKHNLMRTAMSSMIYESEDFTVGLFDADGSTLSIGLGLPMFIRGLSDAIKAKIAHWGRENIETGDILLTNDPQIMGSHLNHMIFTIPVFNEGELIAFSSSMAHWPDVGGVLGGFTRDTFSEGIQIPFLKVFRRGVQDMDLTGMIRANCRLPERAMGDFRAQIACIRTGEQRLTALLRRYGNEAFKTAVRHIFEQSERLARAAVRDIPDGVYEAESFCDDDGVHIGRHIPIKVRVEIKGDEMTVDLSGVSPQVAGNFNSGKTAGHSAAQVAFKFITSPTLEPINDGSFRPVKVILPPGRIVSATTGAPVRHWMQYPMTIIDTIFRALAPACPDKVMAGHHASLSGIQPMAYIDPLTDQLELHRAGSLGGSGGGFGAIWDADGQSGTKCINDGDTHNHPVEAGEAKSPIVYTQRALRQDSGGAGRWRGGLGEITEIEVLQPALVQSHLERTICPPWGLFGAKDALPNQVWITKLGGEIQRFPSGKVHPQRVEAGETCVTAMGGGGGFGSPLDREPWRVLEDVRNEYVSLESAERDYGVVIRRNGRKYELDEAATESLRAEKRAQAAPCV